MEILPFQETSHRSRLRVARPVRVARRPGRVLVAVDGAVALASPFVASALLSTLNWRAVAMYALALAVVTIVAFGVAGEYARRPRPRDGSLRRAGRLALLASFCVWTATLVPFHFDDGFTLGTMYAIWLLLAAGCTVARSLVERLDRPRTERAVVVGSGRVASQLAVLASRHPGRRIDVAGYLDDDPAQTSPAPGPLLGGVDDLPGIIASENIDLVVVAFSRRSDESLLRVLRACDVTGIDVVVVPRLFDVLPPYPRSYDLGGLALLDASARSSGVAQGMAKRAFDLAGAVLALVILAPLLVVIAIAIMIDDGRPVIFRQRRVGRDGRTFTIFKFRTLKQFDEHFGSADVVALKIDETIEIVKRSAAARPTRVGALLRRTSADELPQLWNVLAGHMSLVGPRPLRVFEVQALDDWQRTRLSMRPGMTGLWQVMGRSDVQWDERMRLDCAYVRNWSLASDLAILLRTLPAVILGRGAL